MARNATLRTYKFQSSSSFLPIATTSSIHTLRDTMKLRRNLVFCRREKKDLRGLACELRNSTILAASASSSHALLIGQPLFHSGGLRNMAFTHP